MRFQKQAPHTPSRRERGFTLIELLIVVALIGILATMALSPYRRATVKAKESVLKENLWVMRDSIDQYYADRGKYPSSLHDLESDGYIRKIPPDPMTSSSDSWVEIYEDVGEDDLGVDLGIYDVESGAAS